MKNSNSKFSFILRAFILSILVVSAVYLTGYIVTLVFGFVSLMLYAFGFGGSDNTVTRLIGWIFERFFFSLHAINLPWSMLIFPYIYEYLGLKEVTIQVFVENKLYLLTTAMLTVVNGAVSLVSWGVIRLRDRAELLI